MSVRRLGIDKQPSGARTGSEPLVHRAAAMPAKIDRHVDETGFANSFHDLLGGGGLGDSREILPRHFDARDAFVRADSDDPEAESTNRLFRQFDAPQLVHSDHLPVRDSRRQARIAWLVVETQVEYPGKGTHIPPHEPVLGDAMSISR